MTQSATLRTITIVALMSALIFVLTVLPHIPTPIGGYVHLGDVGVAFSALAFGPLPAAIAGGLGTALADISSGYAQFAIISLLVHGLQGLAMGAIVFKKQTALTLTLAVLVGALIVVGGYFLGELALYGAASALTEIIPNILQGLVGGIIGAPLYLAVRRAYPPLARYRSSQE